MPATVRRLLGDAALGLRLRTPETALPEGVLGEPVSWVHSSDLSDPTPFLSAGQILLTTGTQFPADETTGTTSTAALDSYVQRLATHGIAALGFGTGVMRASIPAGLVDACLARALPLFEVPYRTPFIAVARLAADIAAEDSYARSTWALRAQRAIAVAATRPDGLSATLAELSRQLGRWVALFDAAGTLDRVFPLETSDDAIETVKAQVARLLRAGRRASTTVQVGDETLRLQTLGARGRLRGILVLGGSAELDDAGRQVVTSVIALAGLALEQNHDLDRARGHLRVGLLRLLITGEIESVERISSEMWAPLPAAPVLVAVADVPPARSEVIAERLELQVADASGGLFFAMDGERVVLCVTADASDALNRIAERLDLRLGASAPHAWTDLAAARTQAEQALARGSLDASVTDFTSIASHGVLAFLNGPDAREIGSAVLAPLTTQDRTHGTQLLDTVRAWLANNGEYEATARQLGVHRHTLRARIAMVERLLVDRDLASFAVRADLWAALLAVSGPDEMQKPAIRRA